MEVALSLEYDRTELSLIRLVNGKLPQYPDIASNKTVFDNVLEIRSPQLLTQLQALKGRDDAQVEASLAFLARMLVEIAPDFLAGDLAIFAAVNELTQQRVKAANQWVEAARQTPDDSMPT